MGRLPRHRALALHGFQRHTGFELRVVDPAFLNVLISSFLEFSRCQILAYVNVRFSGGSSENLQPAATVHRPKIEHQCLNDYHIRRRCHFSHSVCFDMGPPKAKSQAGNAPPRCSASGRNIFGNINSASRRPQIRDWFFEMRPVSQCCP